MKDRTKVEVKVKAKAMTEDGGPKTGDGRRKTDDR
jgi:hypothetical protein